MPEEYSEVSIALDFIHANLQEHSRIKAIQEELLKCEPTLLNTVKLALTEETLNTLNELQDELT